MDTGVESIAIILTMTIIVLGALLSVIPTIIGPPALGVLVGTALGQLHTNSTNSSGTTDTTSDNTSAKSIIPYEQWPDECYVCHDSINRDMDIRGQFVVHKGESKSETKAVGLCEECTWTHSTLVDNHDTLVSIYDDRTEPATL